MPLIRHDEYANERANRDPEFAHRRRQTAIELLEGDDQDRDIALRILKDQLGLDDEEIHALVQKQATV